MVGPGPPALVVGGGNRVVGVGGLVVGGGPEVVGVGGLVVGGGPEVVGVGGLVVGGGPEVVGVGGLVVGGGKVVVVGGAIVVVVSGGIVVLGGAVLQLGVEKSLSSRVTEPLRASARPWTFVPVFTVIEVNAKIVPTKLEPVPSVAELPICQNTLHAWAPPTKATLLADPVISVEAIWKIQTELGSPRPSNVTVPFSKTAPPV